MQKIKKKIKIFSIFTDKQKIVFNFAEYISKNRKYENTFCN